MTRSTTPPMRAKHSSAKRSPSRSVVNRNPISVKASKPALSKALHPRNAHQQGYDFTALINAMPALAAFVRPNPYGNLSIDFADPKAVKSLNMALLLSEYHISGWDIPEGYLCPPVPGRVDYLHYIADLLAVNGKVVKGASIRGLDIGTGANGIYPLLGIQSYGWQFVASDIDPVSINNVANIAQQNTKIANHLQLRLQRYPESIFKGIIIADERFDVSLCNPPFHRSLADASVGSLRKVTNLAKSQQKKHGQQSSKLAESHIKPTLNFGGQKAELWCDGGEHQFLANMIKQSRDYASQVLWFTSLVSKSENLKHCYQLLKQVNAIEVKTIEMTQGNKATRILAWSFLTPALRQQWATLRR
ncbi:23S rRNA (adenine(1618)-N(6))-methyltransferase RlmF [Shewanella livingstonensis]|uniref:Ribosomal RNA large subunit methyltransferase F n=1 Tax=Shewanella livingstonensis TaxID=150120 RepID=A0A3G8LPU9_9GAMM|nr:23S rRNA (adenine(1618)-N(6))-methyltransferase RlmF [Shewanella livingstonensis]AZG71539.1 23S rRNA (adenine(1618)-N(6))-methyltransferase RlmF [Shewanella livingstonensis]